MKRVEIFTDGACSGNPGAGGWGAILRYNGAEKELSGGEAETTNNRMELTAVISALAALKEPCNITLYTDSRYVMDGIENGFMPGKRAAGKPPTRNLRSKMPSCGSGWMSCVAGTKSAGSGLKGTPDIRKTNAAMRWLGRKRQNSNPDYFKRET